MLINCKTYTVKMPKTQDYTFIMCLDFFSTDFLPYSNKYFREYTNNQNILCHLCMVTQPDDFSIDLVKSLFIITEEFEC